MNEKGKDLGVELAAGALLGAILGDLFLGNAAVGLVVGIIVAAWHPWRGVWTP